MNAGIFIYGILVFAIVASACAMIAWGIVAERRDRGKLESEHGSALRTGRRQRTATGEDSRTRTREDSHAVPAE